MNSAIKKLKAMLEWSDRLGSDELSEIEEIIEILESEKDKQCKSNHKNQSQS